MKISHYICLSLMATLLFSCKANISSDQSVKDSTQFHANTAQTAPIILKNILLNDQTLITDQKLLNAPLLDSAQLLSLSIKKIDSANSAAYKYHLLDTLFAKDNIKVLLVGRAYVEENVVWICTYKSNALIDYKELYYDNAEGFLSIQTEIKNNLIHSKTYNDFAESEKEKSLTETWTIDANQKFVLKK